ncbi:hypothetical protein ACU639_35645 [Streptomyces cynarae]|uniref:hypothetical protein n=1 Tax=Streptomyces cynarae TaxID=2981134 RepID=UPI00406C4BA4
MLFAACWSFVDNHIFWLKGVLTMLAFAVALALLTVAASRPAEDAREPGRLTNP